MTTARCYAWYDDDDRGYGCELEFGHEPPHREVRDYRTSYATGFRQVTEWWDDRPPEPPKPKDCPSTYDFQHGTEHCVREYDHPGVHLSAKPEPETGLLPLGTYQWLA